MLYTINTNQEGYILSISHTNHDNIELDLDTIDPNYLEAYKLIDSEPVLDEEKKESIIAEKQQEAKLHEIEMLKKNLSDTDYIMAETFEDIMSLDNSVTFIVDFIRIVKQFSTTYASTLANRKAWRERIKELSK